MLCSLVSPEFCYRPGLSAVSEDGGGGGGGGGTGGGAPTRPLPPTPDDDDAHPDRTLVMKRVSTLSIVRLIVLTVYPQPSRSLLAAYHLTPK